MKVFYTLEEEGLSPEQGYDGEDFATDLYLLDGEIIPPFTFESVKLRTGLTTEFDPSYGMKINLRSGVAANTPLLLSNSTGIIEGGYRGEIGILVRNSFIDNKLVDFVFDVKGNSIPLIEVPNKIKKRARERFEEELTKLGYTNNESKGMKELFNTKVPCGTVYAKKHDRIAQAHFQKKVDVEWVHAVSFKVEERNWRVRFFGRR